MEELTYKSIMNDLAAFETWLTGENLKSSLKSIEKIDTAGAQIVVGLLKEHKIEWSDLSDALQSELLFLGVSNG